MNPSPNEQPAACRYRRVSTDHQDGSLELQEKRVLDYAAFKGLAISDGLAFSDPDTSGGTDLFDRTGGRALLNRLKLGDVKHLIVAKVDRIGRNVRDGMATLEFLKEHDITLHIVDLGGESISTQGHIGKLILTLMFAFAEWELGEIRDRTQKRMDGKFDAGELCGNVPFGYMCEYKFANGSSFKTGRALSAQEMLVDGAGRGDVVSKQLVDAPAEQEVIRQMKAFRDITTTPPGGIGQKIPTSYTAIAEELNRRGHRTKQGAKWGCGNVRSVLISRHTARLLGIAPEPQDN